MKKMQENKAQSHQPTQNIQMMRAKPHEEDHNVNTMTRSGMSTGADKGKQPEDEGWVRKVAEKEVDFDLNRAKETFMDAKNNFVEASTSGSQEKMLETSVIEEVDPSVLATFLKTCMKLLHNQKAVEGLQELIDKCENKESTLTDQCIVRKIGKHKM